MDGMNGMSGGEGSGFMPLTTAGVDFHNETQAFNFLQEVLDDSYFQIESNAFARYFWYAMVCTIGVATIFNAAQRYYLNHRSVALKSASLVDQR